MRKYLVAAVLIAAFASPALAEQLYIGYDGKRSEMFSHKPGDKMNLIGTFNSKHDAEKATAGLEGIIARRGIPQNCR